ncbi:2-oxo acid dehydrogenase subunit E2 [Arthrobacter sp. zg-Y859]|uniref:Dihydrolipoamide acetyltransferase component of pyruvate dehydrogenase complex n=1 Tax=Arthrobacter jinronghuae TaxID=2964609 RepID=A0ABT1NNL7_9MICC|nr:dihydrolipoamide acetyltransferase family protein [Arthrobacter jinronghuae]MCQ1948657.1 2-oxo acid dehydrogenase subunit E2 [Arthrobacter jinronghuae]MCQ1955881.1 2-oxo acid dehydrogenase subunit E2 [Arthrobacter jinronghuae]UWX78529.1 2-oxo acid dehydrogenase subunit E2 [Arthrobacter jinronghuae]
MTEKTFRLPDVGEGLTEADIVQWKVSPGDTVAVNDVIVEIETAKSLVELPSPYAGTVSSLMVAEGETVDVGTPIISVTVDDGAGAKVPAAADGPAAAAPEEVPAAPDSTPSETAGEAPAASLTGTGPKPDAVRRRPRRPVSPGAAATPEPAAAPAPAAPAPAPAAPAAPAPASSGTAAAPASSGTAAVQDRVNRLIQRVLAKPPVRKAAKDLGINLADVTATGASGEVTKQDLISYQAQREAERESAGEFWSPGAADSRIERIPVRGVRRATAKAMVESAFSAPHVSIFVDVDASRTMEFVKRLKAAKDFEGIRVSPLLILAKAVIWAAARNPSVNATWAGDEILVKHFMNLGIAAATPRGLMVPNIKDAQELSLKELAIALNTLAATAREGRTPPADMRGGTLTVTNIGSLGIDTGTPIINPGEVAIVAFGTIKQKPWVVDGEVVPRWITTLGGSFDHRVVDGDLSARFMADVASILEEPALLLD